MDKERDEIQDRLRRLEVENLRLTSELEVRKAGSQAQTAFGRFFTKTTTRVVAGSRLKRSMRQLINELPGNPTKDTITDVLVSLVLRLTRLGTFAIMVAAAPLLIMIVQTYMLNRQNHKLAEQNELLGRQNERLDQQINLEEGSRRSSLVFFMSNIMDRIEDELRNSKERKLSDELIGRIVSLSQALRPYRYLENDELTERQLSPERGQLLFSLINSNLNESTYDKIYERANFSYADLREANFSGAYMKNAMLANSFFYKANFNRANLEEADLSQAHLEEAIFIDTKMDKANLAHANLRASHMEGISLVNGNLERADLRQIYLEGDYRGCQLEGIIVQEATLANVDLRGCYFRSLAWLDSMRNDNLKGFASLVEYYEPKLVYQHKGLFVDTFYTLELDENQPTMKVFTCNQAVRELMESCDRVAKAKQQGQSDGKMLKLYPVKSPYGMQDLGITKDTFYLFKLSPAQNSTESTDIWLQFNPAQKKLWEVQPGADSLISELAFDQRFLEILGSECAE